MSCELSSTKEDVSFLDCLIQNFRGKTPVFHNNLKKKMFFLILLLFYRYLNINLSDKHHADCDNVLRDFFELVETEYQ